ncbi:MAG: PAS domain S-box protein [Thermonemataceae bacterium]
MEQPLENNDPEKDFDRLILNELQGMAQVRVAQLFWVTVLVFLGWSVSSYVHTQSYWLDFLWVKVGFIGICLCIYLLFIYQQVSYEWVAHTCLATLTIHNSLFLAFLNQALQAYYFWAYAIIYLVVGLIIIWKPVHSLAQFILALGSIGIIFSMYNPHSLEDFAVYGGLLFITMSLVTTILAKMRYDLARRELTVRVMINRSNKKLYQQQREITKQNRQILESESNLRAILENNDIAIWLINRSYELIEFNELFKSSSYDMFGVTLEKNKSILALQGFASLSDVWKQRYDRALQGEIVKEEDCFRKGPELLYIETTVYPIYAHNEIIGASVFSKDTTEQKAAASQLATSNIRFKAVIESTQDMIFALDENYCYITFNQSHFDFMQVMYRIDIENGDGIMKIPEPSKELQDFRQDIDDALGGQQFTKEYVFKR